MIKYKDLSNSSNKIIHAVTSLAKASCWVIGLKSWHNTGFLISLEVNNLLVSYDISVILDKNNAPGKEIQVKPKPSPSKRKREKDFFSNLKKKKESEPKETEN